MAVPEPGQEAGEPREAAGPADTEEAREAAPASAATVAERPVAEELTDAEAPAAAVAEAEHLARAEQVAEAEQVGGPAAAAEPTGDTVAEPAVAEPADVADTPGAADIVGTAATNAPGAADVAHTADPAGADDAPDPAGAADAEQPQAMVGPTPVPPPPRNPEALVEPEEPTNPRPQVETPASAEANPRPPVETPPPPLPVRPVRRIPASGERVGGYTLGESLGHGGFAHVYRAETDDGGEVAVKILTGLPDDARDRFEQEAQLLERLDGRGFPRYVEADMDAAQPWFAMELVPGSTLLDRVRAKGPLPGREALRLAQQVVDALLVLQDERCLHRDLKPANIMVDGDRAVLIDLGIAKVFDAATSTQPAGTVSYMAPELFGRRVHPRSDVYSLGLLLVFASTGALPPDLNFLGRDLTLEDLVETEPGADADAAPRINRHLLPLILAMTRYQPAHRPPLANIAGVVRARLGGVDADPTLLVTERLVADGVTAAERAVLPATAALPVPQERPTKVFPGTAGADAPSPGRVQEPWHALVYDRELMNVLSEVHADGFDGAASQVIADHVAQLGAHAADGHTPAEIKDWIWQAMRWRSATPPDGHADTLRGWRRFRRPEPSPAPAAPVRATQEPAPPSYAPRKSPVRHLGPAPRTSSVQHLGPAPATPPARSVQRTSELPRSAPPSVRPASTPRPASPTRSVRPDVEATRPMPAARQTPAPTPAAAPRSAQPPTAPRATPPRSTTPRSTTPRPVTAHPAPGGAPRPRRASRFLGALLRWVPRLTLVAAVGLTLGVTGPTALVPWLSYVTDLPFAVVRPAEGPLVAAAAMIAAMVLRAAGHRMHVWFYVLGTVLLSAGAVLLTV